jgi:hypothetical protein
MTYRLFLMLQQRQLFIVCELVQPDHYFQASCRQQSVLNCDHGIVGVTFCKLCSRFCGMDALLIAHITELKKQS